MGTLTESAYYSRKLIKWGIVGFFGLILVRLSFFVLVDVIRHAFPTAPLTPDYAFGKLSKLSFSQTASPAAQLAFSLQTVTGTIPVASEAAHVYFMPKNKPNFLSLSKAQQLVGRIGFSATPRQLSDTVYRWTDTKNPLRSIDFDIVNDHFSLTYAYAQDLTLFSQREIPSPEDTRKETEKLLEKLGLSLTDVSPQTATVRYLKLVADKLEPTTSQSQADAVRVDYFRRDIDSMPVVTDSPTDGIIIFILSGSKQDERRVLYMKYSYWPVDLRSAGIYKLKSSQTAWDELVAGNSFYASLPTGQTQIAITKNYLAFFDSLQPQLFLQPVFVFEGDPKFIGIVPAVTPPWIE